MKLNDIYVLQGRKLIDKDYIKQFAPSSTVDNGISAYRNGKSSHWETYTFFDRDFVDYESLTPMIKERLGNVDDLLSKSIINMPKKSEDTLEYNTEIAMILDFSYTQERLWHQYLSHYTDRFLTAHEITVCTQMHSLIAAMIGLDNEGYSRKEIFRAFSHRKKLYKLYNFNVGSYKYFCQKLEHFKSEGIENVILHRNKFNEKKATLVPKYVYNQIVKAYCQQPVLLYKEIVTTVNHIIEKRGYEPIKLWQVKKLAKEASFQNTYKPYRLGKTWAEDNIDSWLLRAEPRFVGDLFELDGTCLPWYVHVDDHVTRLWWMIMVDVKSRYIVSHAVGFYETQWLAFEVYRLAIMQTGFLPRQIVRDNGKAFSSKLITNLETELEAKQCLVRAARVGNARDKGTVEKTIDNVFTSQFKKYDGFIGDSWKSAREQYRLEPQILREYRKTENAKTPAEVIQFVKQSVNSYNATIF